MLVLDVKPNWSTLSEVVAYQGCLFLCENIDLSTADMLWGCFTNMDQL